MNLLNLNTPIEKIPENVIDLYGVPVYIKRDDLIHPFISGNKWRKLKYIIADAQNKKAKKLVSFGGAYSNHLLALACAGAVFGFETHGFVRGENVDNHQLNLCRMFGMSLQFVSREDYNHKHELFEKYFEHQDAYSIDEGGKGRLAMLGCEEILDDTTNGFSHLVCAVGTGTTLAGLTVGAIQKKIAVEGISVLKTGNEHIKQIHDELDVAVKIHFSYHRGGYAKSDSELIRFISHFAQTTGIILDQVYTAKLLLGVADLCKQGYYKKTDRILVLHSGGILGLLSQKF
jgi:1-aminocyclopropane-1-carboxylate deaminase